MPLPVKKNIIELSPTGCTLHYGVSSDIPIRSPKWCEIRDECKVEWDYLNGYCHERNIHWKKKFSTPQGEEYEEDRMKGDDLR